MNSEVRPVSEWLAPLLAHRPASIVVTVGGLELAVSVWEPSEGTAPHHNFLFVHGNGAQRVWWDAIAPLLASKSRVVALDLSGHGDSDRRDDYTLDGWADEVIDVAQQLFGDARPTLVGHSMGGLIALKAAWHAPDAFRNVITLDAPLRRYTREQLEKRRGIGTRPLPRFENLTSARAGFKTVPPVRHAESAVMAHVAGQSFRESGGEWVLKCDPRIYLRTTDVSEFLRPFPPGTVCVRAEYGLIDDVSASEIRQQLTAGRMIDVPAVGHNLILESPLAVAWLVDVLSERDLPSTG